LMGNKIDNQADRKVATAQPAHLSAHPCMPSARVCVMPDALWLAHVRGVDRWNVATRSSGAVIEVGSSTSRCANAFVACRSRQMRACEQESTGFQPGPRGSCVTEAFILGAGQRKRRDQCRCGFRTSGGSRICALQGDKSPAGTGVRDLRFLLFFEMFFAFKCPTASLLSMFLPHLWLAASSMSTAGCDKRTC
jgi:hypothetical protein